MQRSARSFTLAAASAAFVLFAGCSGNKAGAGDPLDHIVVSPDGATIDNETAIQMRATGVTRSGRYVVLEDVEWSAASGSVDANGVFTPSATGDALVTADASGESADATVHVVAPGTLTVTVVDSIDGAGVVAASVALVGSAGTLTDGSGNATLTGDFAGAIDVHVTAANHWPVTLYGVKSKVVRIPMRPKNPPPSGQFAGAIDFTNAYDSDEPESGHLWIGFAGPALKGNILSFGLDALLGPNREIDIAGGIDAPSNLYVHGITEDYIAVAPDGPTVGFALGGEVSIGEITDILDEVDGSDLGAIVTELIPIFNTFFYATREGIDVSSNQTLTGQDFTLDTRLSKTASVTVPARPVTDPNPLVVAAVDMGVEIGFVPAGFNVLESATATEASLRIPPLTNAFEDRKYLFLTVTQEGGLGTSGSEQQLAVLSRGYTSVSDVEMPSFLTPPPLPAFNGNSGTRVFEFATATGADFGYHVFTRTVTTGTASEMTYQWDVLTAPDVETFTLPMVSGTNAVAAGSNWNVQTLGLESATFESLLIPGAAIDTSTYFNDANKVVITNANVN